MNSLKRWLLPPRMVLVVLGILLLAACAWKAHALGTQPIASAPKIWNTRWFQTALVEGELALGLWFLVLVASSLIVLLVGVFLLRKAIRRHGRVPAKLP